ncbi:MAG: hypothetical protein PWP30_1294 [Eubacteriaceae bacterium]|nr:hypothetical protein [Eubacteriaceae bacterium]
MNPVITPLGWDCAACISCFSCGACAGSVAFLVGAVGLLNSSSLGSW